MKFFRFAGYFSRLRALIGFRAACMFALAHTGSMLNPPCKGKLAHIPVGPYVFYFPSRAYFEGLFTEIFFKETYWLAPTQEAIRVIDCGASIGVSLLYIKIRAPRARVLCFEPNPAARAVLEKNIEANKWKEDVRVLPYALGKKKGAVDFFVDGKETTSSSGSTARHHKNKSRDFNAYSVEVDLLSRHIDQSVDLLKIDIEGSEFDVLEELAAKGKLGLVVALQLEYHYIPGFFMRPLSEMLALLESNGFKTFVESNASPHDIVGHDTPHTYMIFAWR